MPATLKSPGAAPPTALQFADIQTLIAPDMARVDTLIRSRLASDVLLVNQVAEHIVGGGGKRLRPMVCLLAARALGAGSDDYLPAAAIVEFIHTATLLHDDVVDESDLRRGRRTANAVFGNAASVLVGDYLYSRAFQMMADLKRMRIMDVMADTTNRIAEGEVLQLMHIGNAETDEAAYFRVIERKTAVLFEAACRVAAILTDADEATESAVANYGLKLGLSFQIADDVLDYVSDSATLGKNIGDDLAEGKPTLPLIHALARANAEDADTLRRVIETGGLADLDRVIAAIHGTGAITYSQHRARQLATEAKATLTILPESPWKQALLALADYAVDRRS